MVVEQVANLSAGLITEVGQIALWMQALGLVIVIYLIFQTVSLVLNWRRMKEVYKIKEDMKRIENKIDKMLSKKN